MQGSWARITTPEFVPPLAPGVYTPTTQFAWHIAGLFNVGHGAKNPKFNGHSGARTVCRARRPVKQPGVKILPEVAENPWSAGDTPCDTPRVGPERQAKGGTAL